MNREDLQHVTYLGAFLVRGLMVRGDLFRDLGGAYWADNTLTWSDGSQDQASLYCLYAKGLADAVNEGVTGMVHLVALLGIDSRVVTQIHAPHVPENAGVAAEPAPSVLH